MKKFFNNVFEFIKQKYKMIVSNKFNLSIAILTVLFVSFALLTYVWQNISFMAMLCLAIAMFIIAFKVKSKHKDAKNRYNVALSKKALSGFEQKKVKAYLLKLKFSFIALVLVGLFLCYSVVSVINTLINA